ncbi:MAG TPA: hypothetical protein VNJ08_05445 [Bacteriovoracaceae bacterium]|nr:hypothetical protein [Bacteriovoracaceae bacterium]
MSLFQELKDEFETEIGIPVVENQGGRFVVLGDGAFSITYGFEDGDLPEIPQSTYGSLFAKSYFFNEWFGDTEQSFAPYKKAILLRSFDAFADAMERLVLADDPCTLHNLASADDLVSAAESFGDYPDNASVGLNHRRLSDLKRTILNGRTSIIPTKLPYSWNYLDSVIPLFAHSNKSSTKVIVFHKNESFVISDIEYKISKRRLWLTFLIGLNSMSKVKIFN